MPSRSCSVGIGFIVLSAVLVSPLCAATGDSFSFAVIADPHLSGGPESDSGQKLQQCIDWINAHRGQENIDLVFAAGDLGFGDNGADLQTAKSLLDGLEVPYVPLIGDNEIQFGDEQNFASLFEPVYQSLAALASDPNSRLSNWDKAPTQVWNPQIDDWSYFQNFAFDYGGVHFSCLDWCSRNDDLGEDADLHDFEGGTWSWFSDDIAHCPKDKEENIVMVSHNPMFTLGGILGEILSNGGALSTAEFAQFSAFLEDPNHDYGAHVQAAYAGHFHYQGFLPEDADPNRIVLPAPDALFDPNLTADPNLIEILPLPGHDLYVVGATHLDPVRFELVTVTERETDFAYTSRSIVLPEPTTAGLLLTAVAIRRHRRRRRGIRGEGTPSH